MRDKLVFFILDDSCKGSSPVRDYTDIYPLKSSHVDLPFA